MISQPFYPCYMTRERMAMAPNLKAAITAGIGSDHVDLQAAMDRNVDVCEVTFCNSISVSEHVVMQMLALVRNYIPSYKAIKDGGWNIADCVSRSYDIEGMKVGTVAAGRIGLAVLKRLHPFDCELHYCDRHRLPKEVEEKYNLHHWENWKDMAAEMDIVTLNCPLHPETEHMVNSETINCFKRAPRAHPNRAPCPPSSFFLCARRPLTAPRPRPRRAPFTRRRWRLHREHRARQALRQGRHRQGPRGRPARRLRGRRVVPAAAARRPRLALHAVARHDAAHLGHLPLGAGKPARPPRALPPAPAAARTPLDTPPPSPSHPPLTPPLTPTTTTPHTPPPPHHPTPPLFIRQARYAAGVREILENYFEGKELRNEYQIVTNGNLAGVGAHSYSKGNATGGSEDAVGKVK